LHATSVRYDVLHATSVRYTITVYTLQVKTLHATSLRYTIYKMDKYKNKYRIPSARLQNWDYRWAGAYFITICTQNREYYFGDIINGKMQLSNIGVIADILWHEIKNHAQNVELGEFIVMPNHIHGILILNNNYDADNEINDNDNDNDAVANEKNELMSKISPKQHSISSIIRSYKSAVSKHAHRLGYGLEWQTRFHEHIIRDDKSYQTIKQYIINNPSKWNDDKFYNQ